MSLQATLFKLKAAFKPYEVFWGEWKEKQENHLDLVEKSTIEVHLKNNFILTGTKNLMSCDVDEELLELIISKLKARQFIYNYWIVTQFKAKLNKLAKPLGRKRFYETPISELEIPSSLKIILLNLNTKNLIRYYNNKKLYELIHEDTFNTIMVFCIACKQQKNKNTAMTKQTLALTK